MRGMLVAVGILCNLAVSTAAPGPVTVAGSENGAPVGLRHPDPVVARVHEHIGDVGRPIVVVVGPADVPRKFWQRVKHLVAYRVHRPLEGGGPVTDAAIYIVDLRTLFPGGGRASNGFNARGTRLVSPCRCPGP